MGYFLANKLFVGCCNPFQSGLKCGIECGVQHVIR
jgi:hypothetical protein